MPQCKIHWNTAFKWTFCLYIHIWTLPTGFVAEKHGRFWFHCEPIERQGSPGWKWMVDNLCLRCGGQQLDTVVQNTCFFPFEKLKHKSSGNHLRVNIYWQKYMSINMCIYTYTLNPMSLSTVARPNLGGCWGRTTGHKRSYAWKHSQYIYKCICFHVYDLWVYILTYLDTRCEHVFKKELHCCPDLWSQDFWMRKFPRTCLYMCLGENVFFSFWYVCNASLMSSCMLFFFFHIEYRYIMIFSCLFYVEWASRWMPQEKLLCLSFIHSMSIVCEISQVPDLWLARLNSAVEYQLGLLRSGWMCFTWGRPMRPHMWDRLMALEREYR